MSETGKKRFGQELEKFVITRLRPFPEFPYTPSYTELENPSLDARDRLQMMDSLWNWNEYRYRTNWEELVNFPQLTNHEICHEMFWNAFRGRSKMYIQVQDLRSDNWNSPDKITVDSGRKSDDDKEVITLQCSLLTLQMLDYDIMMFRAMGDTGDEKYRNAAQKHYRPYLFSYVAEISREKYKELRKLQEKLAGDEKTSPYLWLSCTFNPDIDSPHVDLTGYAVQSASNIDKMRVNLSIIENEKTPIATVNSILDAYKLGSSCIKDDISFTQSLESKLGHDCLSTIDVYKIGNGNCVFAQGKANDMSFFYDIGFNYRHRPQKISHGGSFSYSATMKEICKKKPSFIILSHWDMDHIAGSAVMKKSCFDIDWFAPDCYDACANARRLSKYLDMKGHLFLAERHSTKTPPGRLISRQIDIKSITLPSQVQATYRLYMGEKAGCDSSYPNCEGIVIEYTDVLKGKTVLMMGDVNYASFNAARLKTGTSFADTQIDYLIVPHHGSQHTDHPKITENNIVKKGDMAIICCTNDPCHDRPNCNHRKELEKRFEVRTTEQVKKPNVSIQISF